MSEIRLETYIWSYWLYFLSGLGILLGAHRLWTHRSFKAHPSVKIMLMLLQTMAMQRSIYVWSRDHRIHHKFSETNADPHNSKRGFFFSHVGWLLVRKHPDFIAKRKAIDIKDLKADPVVMWQKRYMFVLSLLFGIGLPVAVPVILWNETLLNSLIANIIRYLYALHATFLVNSAAHMYGIRPYDEWIEPRESQFAIYFTFGEGYHNFHHSFPYDSNCSEYGWKYNINVPALLLDMFKRLNLVTDLKFAPKNYVAKRKNTVNRHDGTRRQTNYIDTVFGIILNSSFFWISFIYSRHIKQ